MLIGSSSEVVGCPVYILSPDVSLRHLQVSGSCLLQVLLHMQQMWALSCSKPAPTWPAKTMVNYSYLYQASHNHGKVGGEGAHALVDELNA